MGIRGNKKEEDKNETAPETLFNALNRKT